ncbi:hypothetical protein NC652_037168 [Populus alba x Populus x berolinensis]|uniref:Uncharacterized protein n=1 Tax=Populus alba x Populus x berolinensis TaxID=444605 RepID=A0AAD6LP36_9ROSI|nr:hypothetical protein NC652_037158 [Populus alba x Populus x berolinensis]KAJ6871719.1 hypothetical protein NC652_037162 [Populus alba x Populus x berolinensis]KAJ6871725.1 hypothetical protein NC652_037168 [Populus alba x Populus x berolinensis]KAJ6969197.1 hypothetical protein NC653_036996 [Populus alba x Populus x berolinensis]
MMYFLQDRWLPTALSMQWMPKLAIFYGHTTPVRLYTAAYQQVTGVSILEMAIQLAWQGSTLLGLVELLYMLSALPN